MRKRQSEDMKIGYIHYSINYGLYIITVYVNNKKVCVYFFKTGTEKLFTSSQIRKGKVFDGNKIYKHEKIKELTQKILKTRLEYSEISGVFLWKCTSGRANHYSVAGRIDKSGYRVIGISGKKYMAHRIAWLYMYGRWPENDIDHINHIRDDNSILNLRSVTRSVNLQNSTRSKRNKSGVTGVFFSKRNKKWMAGICVNSKQKSLGYFNHKNDAVIARKMAEKEYGYHENHGDEK